MIWGEEVEGDKAACSEAGYFYKFFDEAPQTPKCAESHVWHLLQRIRYDYLDDRAHIYTPYMII